MRSYVINLDRNPQRMALISRRFKELGILFERFPAVDGRQISDTDLKSFADCRPAINRISVWSKGSMGCFLSHYKIWQIAAISSDPYTAYLKMIYMRPISSESY